MDRAEAIMRFEKQLTAAKAILDTGFGASPGESNRVYVERKEMAAIALAALREQEQREQWCEWCSSLDKKNKDFKCGDLCARGVVEHTFWGDGRMYSQIPNFCPMCGRKLTKEGAEG